MKFSTTSLLLLALASSSNGFTPASSSRQASSVTTGFVGRSWGQQSPLRLSSTNGDSAKQDDAVTKYRSATDASRFIDNNKVNIDSTTNKYR